MTIWRRLCVTTDYVGTDMLGGARAGYNDVLNSKLKEPEKKVGQERKTWKETINHDTKVRKLNDMDPDNLVEWRKALRINMGNVQHCYKWKMTR